MFYLLLGLLLVIALVLIKQWFRNTDPKVLWKQMRFTGLLIGIGLFLFLLVTGRLAWIWAAVIWMLPWLSRLNILSGILQAFQRRPSAQQSQSTATSDAPMTAKRAAEILNVDIHASEEDIRRAHKELMKRNHPDSGGSDYLAQMLNQARDVLLTHRG